MSAHNRKLSNLILDIGGNEFQLQCRKAEIVNNTDDPEVFKTFAPNGGYVESADPSFALDLEFVADWTPTGVSTYLWEHDGETVPFELTHHPDFPTDTVVFSGNVQIKAPGVGGEVGTTEITTTTLVCEDKPEMVRP